MLRLVATATAATALVFSPTPGVLVLSPALTGPRTTFSVGPHAGESYERVWREDPQFCVWALEQRRPVWKSRHRAGVASMALEVDEVISTQASAAGGTRGLPDVAAVEEQSPARPGQAHDAAPEAHRADARGVPRHPRARTGLPAPGGARRAPNNESRRKGPQMDREPRGPAPHARPRGHLRASRSRRPRRGRPRVNPPVGQEGPRSPPS